MLLDNPLYRPLLEVLRLLRNGVVYGGKTRFSHALVISLLYRLGPLRPRLQQVLRALRQHGLVLALFAIVYKTLVKVLQQEQMFGSGSRMLKLVAGAFGGWVVYLQHFGAFNPGITHQITLYCFLRVTLALGKILLDLYLQCRQPTIRVHGLKVAFQNLSDAQAARVRAQIYNKLWKYFAVLVWALVMFIYDFQPQYLQSSLRHLMAYIYDVENDSWGSWREFLGV